MRTIHVRGNEFFSRVHVADGIALVVIGLITNAMGMRVRDYPIRLDKLIGGLPDVA